MRKEFWIICATQCLVVLVLFLGDIGFDKPGRFGLDYEHFLLLMLLQGCLFAAAVSMILFGKHWKYLGIQFLLFIVTAVGVATN